MYVVHGATGHTGGVIVRTLLAEGHAVRAIGRSAEKLKPLEELGAEPVPANVGDREQLEKAYKGADAAYVMIPPDMESQDYRREQDLFSTVIAAALQSTKVKHVVALSSIGADKESGTGPVTGLHVLENRLREIPGLNSLSVRAAYFMENTLPQAGIIAQMGVAAGPLRGDLALPMIATADIGDFAAAALTKLDFSGHQTQELLGQRDLSMNEVTRIIGAAIGKPDLNYVQPPNEQLRPAFAALGMSEDVTRLILEMAGALNSGYMTALEQRTPRNTTATSYEEFVANVLMPYYRQVSSATAHSTTGS